MPIFIPPAGSGGGAAQNVTTLSGSLEGLMVGGVAVSLANPVPNFPAASPSGQALSGSTVRTIQYSFATGSVSGSSLSNQLLAPQGANNRIRVLALSMMTANACNVQFQSTGSAGTVTNVSSIYYLPASGGDLPRGVAPRLVPDERERGIEHLHDLRRAGGGHIHLDHRGAVR